MGENEYKISLGVKLDTDDIKSQINAAEAKADPIKIKIDAETKELTNTIKEALKSLTSGTKSALTLDTTKIEASLKDVSSTIKAIKTSIGTLDSKSGMKSLLSSINQISKALDKASDKFGELNANLNALSGKDLSLNFGINLGGSNSVARQGVYGSKVRNETLPQLKQQVSELVKYYNSTYKESFNEFEALQRMVSGTKLNNGDFFEGFLYGKDSVATRMSSGSLSSQMQAYKAYIDMFKQAAGLKGLDLSSVTAGFSKSADELIKDAQDVQTGAKEMENSFEKLKQILGGSGIDAEGLGQVLEPIITDLREIKEVLQGLSSSVSLEGLTQSFDRLSETIEKLVQNAMQVKSALGDGLNVTVADGNTDKVIREQKELAQTSSQTADTVAKSGEKIQQAYKKMSTSTTSVSGLDSLELKDDITDADRLTAALSKLKNIQSQISKIDTGKISTSKTVQELQALERQLESLSAEYNETVAEINNRGGVSATQLQSFENQIRTTELTVERLQSKLKSEIKLKISIDVPNQLSKAHTDFDNLSNKTNDLKQKLDLLDNIKVDLDTAAANDDIDGLQKKYRELIRTLSDFNTQLSINKRTEQSAFKEQSLETAKAAALSRLDGLFEQGSEAAKKYGTRVEELRRQINACGNTNAVGDLNKQIATLGREIDNAKVKTQTFSQSLRDQWEHYKSYLSVASLISYGTQALRSMFEQVKLIDSAMTELKKVTDETAESYEKFLTNAAKRSKEIGTTIDGLVSSTADFARLGYGFEDAQGLAEVANIYAVVGDEIEGVEGATESLISTMAAFKDEFSGLSNTDSAMRIIDIFNELGNNFAISSGGLGEAFERSASSLAAANNSIYESAALITAANTVVGFVPPNIVIY